MPEEQIRQLRVELTSIRSEVLELNNKFAAHADSDSIALNLLKQQGEELANKLRDSARQATATHEAVEGLEATGKELAKQLKLNTDETKATREGVANIQTILNIGRAASTFAGGVRKMALYWTPILAFAGIIAAYVMYYLGKGPFPLSK